jgi:hypothetical protein
MDGKIITVAFGLVLFSFMLASVSGTALDPASVASGIEYEVYQPDYDFIELRQFHQGNPEYTSFNDGPPVWGWMNFFWDPVPGFPADGTVEVFLIQPANQVSPRDWVGVKFAETTGEEIRTVRFNLDSDMPRGYVFQLIQEVNGRKRVVWQTRGLDQGIKEIDLSEGVLTESLEFRVKRDIRKRPSFIIRPIKADFEVREFRKLYIED